jgi:type II secretory pathway component PulF
MRQDALDPRLARVLGALEHGVGSGLPLSGAMAGMPRAFPPLLTQMVRAGETTGQLGEMLLRTVEAMEIEAQMRSKLRSAMLYPGIMFTLTVGVVIFLLTTIVPKFETLLVGKELPRPTVALLAIGNVVRQYGYFLAAGFGVAVAGLVLFLRTTRGTVLLDALLLRAPGVSGLYRTAVLARCARTFGLLLQAGVPMHAALEHTQEIAGSHAFRSLWARARSNVINGGSLVDAIRGSPLLDSNFQQLVGAGESTATLDRVLHKIAGHHTKDLDRRVRDLVTIVEPIMVVAMAGIVGFVALSIMMPIFQMSRR